MYSEHDKDRMVQLIAAAISSGSSLDEAWDLASDVLDRLNLDVERTEAPQPASEEIVVYMEPVRDYDDEIVGYVLEYAGRRVKVDIKEVFLLESMEDFEYTHLSTIKRKVFCNGEHIDTKETESIPNYKVYNLIRDVKQSFSHIGLTDVIRNKKGEGFYLNNIKFANKPKA